MDDSLNPVIVPLESPDSSLSQEVIQHERNINFYADTNIHSICMHRKALIVQSEVNYFGKKLDENYIFRIFFSIMKGWNNTINRWN